MQKFEDIIFTPDMSFFYHFGKYLLFLKGMFSKPEKLSVYIDRTITEMNNIGVGSLAIVVIIAIFQGAVTTLQIAYQLISPLISKPVIGSIVSDSSMLELAPTIPLGSVAGRRLYGYFLRLWIEPDAEADASARERPSLAAAHVSIAVGR